MSEDYITIGDVESLVETEIKTVKVETAKKILKDSISKVERTRKILSALESELEDVKKIKIDDIESSNYVW